MCRKEFDDVTRVSRIFDGLNWVPGCVCPVCDIITVHVSKKPLRARRTVHKTGNAASTTGHRAGSGILHSCKTTPGPAAVVRTSRHQGMTITGGAQSTLFQRRAMDKCRQLSQSPVGQVVPQDAAAGPEAAAMANAPPLLPHCTPRLLLSSGTGRLVKRLLLWTAWQTLVSTETRALDVS